MAFSYPPARRCDVVDTYHGREVADPYRWLEDPESDETRAFVAAQNEVSLPYLTALPEREPLRRRMTELWNIPRTDAPTRRGDVTVWTHNDGLANQSVFWIRRGGGSTESGSTGNGETGQAEVLLDPNTMSEDGTVAVVVSSLSPDGRLLAYTVSEAGSDRQRLAIRSTETGHDLDDRLDHLRFTSIAWWGDGFFYTRWPQTEPASTAPVRNPSIHYHRIGDAQADDRLIFRNDEDPEPSYAPVVTEDDRYLILVEYLGTDRRNGLLYLDLTRHTTTFNWVRLVDHGQALHDVVHHEDGRLVVHTDREAPNGAVVEIDLDHPEPDRWTTVVAEGPDPVEWVAALDGSLVVNRLVDSSHRLERYRLDGEPAGEIPLPGPGSVTGVTGRFADPDIHLGYQSFVEPPAALVHHRGETTTFASSEPPLDPATTVVERRNAVSSDGREVGMFVVRLAGTELPGPVELYGYGGFSINLTPLYSPARLAFLEAGGIVVVANLRGGTERGENWHTEGRLGRKQQVFDDLFACARSLIDGGVATAATLGIRGGSNGGLLTAAAMIQQPDLFGAVVSQVPVTDMLRYQHFTAGRFWTVEYGQADDPEAFQWLIDYSPLHNVGDASTYPPLLITTAESDDRVVPLHSHKFAAEVQYRAGGRSAQPLLERVETRAGHGLGKPTAKLIEESADIYAFLLHHLRP